MTVVGLILCGLLAGVIGGMLGVGGGIIFVPALVLIVGLTQVEAEATSLLAIIPLAAAAVWRQRSYDNVRMKDGLVIGAVSVFGTAVGVLVSNTVSGNTLQIMFAVLLFFIAVRMAMRAVRP